MYFRMWALYAGPDQVMAVTSALASLFGVLLIFWNKVVGTFLRIFGMSRKDSAGSASPTCSSPKQPDNPSSTGVS